MINGTSGSSSGHVIGVAAGIRSSGGTVVNYGQISATSDAGRSHSSVGISFNSSGTVINHGVIKGTVPAAHGAYGILGKAYEVASQGCTIVNYGTIAGIGTYSTGIRLVGPAGDSLTNAAGALAGPASR